jgi:hypothetical protein
MKPADVDDLGDEDFAAMVRLMQREAAEIERAQRRAARRY